MKRVISICIREDLLKAARRQSLITQQPLSRIIEIAVEKSIRRTS